MTNVLLLGTSLLIWKRNETIEKEAALSCSESALLPLNMENSPGRAPSLRAPGGGAGQAPQANRLPARRGGQSGARKLKLKLKLANDTD